jgi:hypothetical protein
MRHLFLPSGPILLLPHFVVQPAAFRLLIPLAGAAQLFRAYQWRTERAVPVATIATATDEYEMKTTLAVENPAVL